MKATPSLRIFSLACALLAAAASRVLAQTALSPNRVTFYSEPNYKGESLVVEAGAAVENLDSVRRSDQRPWTYAISSVKIDGAAKAVVFTGAGFSGERAEILANVSDLYAIARPGQPGASWDRAIAAVQIVGPRPVVVEAPPPPVRYETPPPPPTAVYVVPVPAGPPPVVREVRPMLSPREADAIVQHAYRDVLNRPADPPGLRVYRERLMRDGWSERQIVEQLQRSPEARAINADEAITRMYREVLGRDPDPSGLGHYRALWRDGWTQGQIREDLRRSDERHDTRIQAAITRAYRELLGREPDPAGFATYERLMRDKGYSERDIRSAIMSGDEYRQLHPRGR